MLSSNSIPSRHPLPKRILLIFLPLLAAIDASAQGDFGDGLNQATADLIRYLDPITNIVLVIGCVVGVIGGLRIHQKWSNGDQDINKELMAWAGASLFLILVPTVLRAIFGV